MEGRGREQGWEVGRGAGSDSRGRAASSVVTLVFPEEVRLERLVFVLDQLGPDTWVRDHGEDSLQGRRDRGCKRAGSN